MKVEFLWEFFKLDSVSSVRAFLGLGTFDGHLESFNGEAPASCHTLVLTVSMRESKSVFLL